jgi:hypothetical protein
MYCLEEKYSVSWGYQQVLEYILFSNELTL